MRNVCVSKVLAVCLVGAGLMLAGSVRAESLPTPTGVSATDGASADYIRVTWNAVSGATGYVIYRGESADYGDSTIIDAVVGETSMEDTTASLNVTYYFWVRAVSLDGRVSAYSAPDTGYRGTAANPNPNPSPDPSPSPNPDNGDGGSGDLGGGTHTPGAIDNADGDLDGDGIMDPTFYKEDNGMWMTLPSGNYDNPRSGYFGGPGWTALMADFDRDGRADPTVYNRASGRWVVLLSGSGFSTASADFGGSGYDPVIGDYDADGKADLAVYNAAQGRFYAMLSSTGYNTYSLPFGGSGYVPCSGDFDGDGKTDPAVFSGDHVLFRILLSSRGYSEVTCTVGLDTQDGSLGQGAGPYIPVPLDYDGDRITDPAIYSYTTSEKQHVFSYFVLLSTSNFQTTLPFPQLAREDAHFANTEPTPGDYDGDGKADFAVVWPDLNDPQWRMWRSENNYSGYVNGYWGITGLGYVKRW